MCMTFYGGMNWGTEGLIDLPYVNFASSMYQIFWKAQTTSASQGKPELQWVLHSYAYRHLLRIRPKQWDCSVEMRQTNRGLVLVKFRSEHLINISKIRRLAPCSTPEMFLQENDFQTKDLKSRFKKKSSFQNMLKKIFQTFFQCCI